VTEKSENVGVIEGQDAHNQKWKINETTNHEVKDSQQ